MATQTGSIDLRGVKQSYESVEVGGRNLLLDSEYMSSWYKGSGASIDNGIATLVGSSSNWNSVLSTYKYDAGLYDGTTTYIWSFEYKSSIACSITPVIAGTAGTVDSDVWSRTKYVYWRSSFSLPSSGGEWKTYVFDARTIAISQLTTGSGDVVSGYLQLYARTDNANIQIRHLKLEKGNKATTWTPAPEDVQEGIDNAQTAANDAQSTANTAQTTANDAQNAANTAQTAADNAAMNAADAAESANNAQIAADEAKSSISNIEYIVGASSWVTEHGIYNKSTDTTVDATKEYYTVSATAVSNPTGSPHKGLYYERSNNVYTLTSDDIVVSGKTYYTLAATLVGSPTGNPSSNGYYEQRLNESIEDYLSTHIRTNADGLFVTDGSASQVRINSSGVSIWNGEEQIASYGSVAQVGALNKFHILIGGEENEIGFYFGDSKMAYLNGDELYVQNSLSFGNEPFATFTFYQRANGHFTLKLVNQE